MIKFQIQFILILEEFFFTHYAYSGNYLSFVLFFPHIATQGSHYVQSALIQINMSKYILI